MSLDEGQAPTIGNKMQEQREVLQDPILQSWAEPALRPADALPPTSLRTHFFRKANFAATEKQRGTPPRLDQQPRGLESGLSGADDADIFAGESVVAAV